MRIHCKIVVIAVCVGVFLLLYFLGGNSADDPLLKEVEVDNSSPSSSPLGHSVASKLTKKSQNKLNVRAEQPIKERKERKVISRGGNVNARR